MKKLFIFLNIILFICVVFLFMLHFSHKTPPPEKILKQTPSKANITVKPVFKQRTKNLSSTQIALISGNDLFSPARGVDPATLKTKTAGQEIKHNQLELTGIFKMGDLKGAIISSNIGRNANSNKKKVYVIGKKIGDTSYILQDINTDDESVVVSLGTSQFVLKLERNDPSSLNRRNQGEAASKARAMMSKPPVSTTPPPTAFSQKKGLSVKAPGTPSTQAPTTPKALPKARTKQDMRRVRQAILKKMMERRNQKK